MDMHLTGKTAIVTGASKGIGLAISRALTEAGVHVFAGARNNSAGLRELEAAGSAQFVPVDLTTVEGPVALVEAAAERGGVDLLVNNAGAVVPHLGGFLSVTDADWYRSLELGLMATVRTTRAALPHMLGRAGAIVVIGSVNAILPDPNIIDYTATKAALANLANGLSKELGPKGIRVNTISPGPVSTDLWLGAGGVAEKFAAAGGGAPDAVVASVASAASTGRFTTPQEVADLAVFLLSDRAANITGADVRIDGGYITTI